MTAAIRPSPAKRTSYFALSKAPRYSVLFALPLLVAYETLAAVLAQPGRGEIRNGADVLLRNLFTAAAGPKGPAIFMGVVVVLGVFLVLRDLRSSRAGVKPAVFAGMLLESAALAAAFGVVIGVATAKLLGSLRVLAVAQSPLQSMSWTSRLMLSLGAGLYEELLFRVLLVGGLALGARVLLGLSPRVAGVVAVVIGATIFSAFHYIGPFGDPFQIQSFTFRLLSGVAFSGLYLLRGFGVTAWTHALYDGFLLLL